MKHSNYTILVNSCDAFSDCWDPFFQLYATYWADHTTPIVLNTETKSYSYPNLPIRTSCVGNSIQARQLTWSEALIACLDLIETDLVLYLQEDYFLNGHADLPFINQCAELMVEQGISTVQLTVFGSQGPFHPTAYPELWEIDQHAPYRIAMQAALWQKDHLRAYLRPHENGWQCELFGSVRARRRRDLFYCLNREVFSEHGRHVFPYVKTGIIKSQWYAPAVVELFQLHHIEIDFSRRGFYQAKPRSIERLRTLALMLRQPRNLLRSLWMK